MNKTVKKLRGIGILCVSAAIGIAATNAFGQAVLVKDKVKTKEYSFCSNNWSNGDQVSVNDLRESTVASSGSINVDSGRNGGISVKGEDRSDVLVRACVQAWGPSEEGARATIASVRISTGGEIKADGPDNANFSVSYQLLVPRSTNVNLKAHNGGISLSNVDGDATFETTNGGISISNLSGKVRGRTANGGVNAVLSGTSWKGSGLDLQTTNGGVNLVMPRNYAATVETGTVNGGFKSDIPALTLQEDVKGEEWGRARSKKIVSSINGGGAPIRVITTNGGVKISSLDD